MEYDPSIDIAEDPEVYPPSDDSILLIESLDVVPGEKVLEVGCGSGVVSIHCAKNGCAISRSFLETPCVKHAAQALSFKSCMTC